MAYQIQQGDIAQVTVQYVQLQVEKMLNVFHYRYTGTNPIADGAGGISRLIFDFRSNLDSLGWDALWPETAATLVSIDRYRGQKIYPVRYRAVEVDVAIPGVRTGNPLPAVVQWSVARKADIAARYGIGGIRVPGLSEDDEQAGQILEAHRPACEALAVHLRTSLVGNAGETWEPVILRRQTPGVSEVVTSSAINIDLSTQRTRRVFRGI